MAQFSPSLFSLFSVWQKGICIKDKGFAVGELLLRPTPDEFDGRKVPQYYKFECLKKCRAKKGAHACEIDSGVNCRASGTKGDQTIYAYKITGASGRDDGFCLQLPSEIIKPCLECKQ